MGFHVYSIPSLINFICSIIMKKGKKIKKPKYGYSIFPEVDIKDVKKLKDKVKKPEDDKIKEGK